MKTKQTNLDGIAETYAQIIENPETNKRTANKIWKHIRQTIEETDLTHPETIRLLYPVAAQIVADNERKRKEFLRQRQSTKV